jgi:PLD-like domain
VSASLLDLPSYLRQRLVRALETGVLAPPYSELAVRGALGGDIAAAALCAELQALDHRGIGGPSIAFALGLAADARASIDRPDLVWSGESVPGLHARKTRQVFDELVLSAQKSLWICSYAYYNGPKAFEKLATCVDAKPELHVTLLLNIRRDRGDTTPAAELAAKFADRLWTKGWPGTRRPDVYYDPRSLKGDGGTAVLHAKAVVVDDAVAFVTSANLTEKAFDENIEVGMLSRNRTLATSLSQHFRVLIDRRLLEPLPS